MATVTKPRKKASASHQTKMLIDGKFRDSVSGKTFETINPATEEVIAQVAEGDGRRHRPGRQGRRARRSTPAPGGRWTPATAAG